MTYLKTNRIEGGPASIDVVQLAKRAWEETGEGWTATAWFDSRAKSFERFAELLLAAAPTAGQAAAKTCGPVELITEREMAIRTARKLARLMLTEEGHEVVCIEPKIWEAICSRAAGQAAAKDAQKPSLPFSLLDEELADLMRFHECAMDDEGYDVPKERMKNLAEIGLVRRVSANYYEATTFGLAVINGEFSMAAAPEVK